MPDLIHVNYASTGKSKSTNPQGMLEMQARVNMNTEPNNIYCSKLRLHQVSPRALMFLVLAKIHHQGLKKPSSP